MIPQSRFARIRFTKRVNAANCVIARWRISRCRNRRETEDKSTTRARATISCKGAAADQ